MSNISAVLPLSVTESKKSNSCELVDILLTSLKKFATPNLFAKFFIICPPLQVPEISKHMQKHEELPIQVLNELDVVPTLRKYAGVGGWRLQQIIKLQAAMSAPTPFCITFDADVVCTHPLTESQLLPGGKALIQMGPRKNHADWWRSSAHHLKAKPNLREPGMFVTPALLATEAVRGLVAELSKNGDWIDNLMKPHMPKSLLRYMPFFGRKHRWTEYTLYYLFLEKYGLLSRYHVDRSHNTALMRLVSDRCVWRNHDFESWDASYCFSPQDRSFFTVIQSNKNISPAVVRSRLDKFIS